MMTEADSLAYIGVSQPVGTARQLRGNLDLENKKIR